MLAPDLITARLASTADLVVLQALRGLAIAETAGTRGGDAAIAEARGREIDTAFVNARNADGATAKAQCLVGVVGDAVAGYALVATEAGPYGKLAMLHELYVHPDMREIGVGDAILGFARAWATARGCVEIESQVLPGNRSAKNFFERAGMVTRLMRVSSRLN